MGDQLRLLPYGQRAVLVELPDSAARRALTRWLGEQSPADIDVVPGECTILLDVSDPTIDDATAHAHLSAAVRRLRELDIAALPPDATADTAPVVIEVRYDGPDLQDVADLFGVSVESFVRWHTSAPWFVEFLGFMPGFGYLTRSDHQQPVERRRSPRSAIPAGSVGLAGRYCGIYPGSSPGGWQLLGHTDHVLFDAEGAGATLSPNDRVQFQVIR